MRLDRLSRGTRPTRNALRQVNRGFALPAAIFLLTVMAGLAAFMIQVSSIGQQQSALDLQGARAYQAARMGIEFGIFQVQINSSCAASTTLASIPGLTGLKVTVLCSASSSFTDEGTSRQHYQITASACSTTGASCPSATTAELQSTDYVERQLIAVTEK